MRCEIETPEWCTIVRADNPGPMTLDGTNTYVLRRPGAADCVVVDPGPGVEAHLRRVAAYGPVALVLLTHAHPDHAEGASRFHEMTGAPVLARAAGLSVGDAALGEDGEDFAAGGLPLRVLATPGHTADSVCFVVNPDGLDGPTRGARPGGPEPAVLTGDTILGRGTTVVAHPDGDLGSYLVSLRRLRDLGDVPVLPGHGPALPSVAAAAQSYLQHRAERLEQVRAALAAGDRTPAEIVSRVYADVDRAVWPAAEQSVRAQLAYLQQPS